MRIAARFRGFVVLTATLVVASCGESPTGPTELSATDAARVAPSVSDARLRLTEGIVTPSFRARVKADLEQIELALNRLDGRTAAFRTRLLRDQLINYAARPGGDHEDDADVSAIGFVLAELTSTLSLSVDLLLFP